MGDTGMASGGGRTAQRTARTDERDDLYGWRRLGHDLRHRRRRFRQFAGVVLVFLLTLAGRPEPAPFAIGVVVVLVGMGIRMWASGHVMKNETLATDGPYAHVRHPLYVGNVVIAVGFCLASGVWWSVVAAAAVLLVFYPPAIRYEDQKLQRLFPGEWDRWAAETRALVPRLEPYRSEGSEDGGGWSLRRSLVRNGEPIHVVVGLACLAYLFTRLG
jgi:protein-S-isoprenylcysteine O-methyltransferase Ste14